MNDEIFPVSKKEATALGSKFFLSGKPCPHGHNTLRFTSTSYCIKCQELINKAARLLPPQPISESVWRRFDKYIPHDLPKSECWHWKGSLDKRGYGQLSDGFRTMLKAHRLSYEKFVGSIPEGLGILHKCDLPSCCNPDHLFPGTQKENIDDMISKGRWGNRNMSKGSNHYKAKFTDEQIIEIRNNLSISNVEFSIKYMVSPSTIQRIKTGITYAIKSS